MIISRTERNEMLTRMRSMKLIPTMLLEKA
jgi:hypothetical protein